MILVSVSAKKLIGNAVLEQFGKLLILVAGQALEMGQGKP